MAEILPDGVQSPEPVTPASPASGDIPLEHPPKLKGRQRLLKSLQRMSSSPSLAKLGRSSSSKYRSSAKGSMSCVSLSSSYRPCLGSPSSSQIYGGLSARPVPPGSTNDSDTGSNARIRVLDSDSSTPNLHHPTSVPLPTELKPTSRSSSRPASRGTLLESSPEVPEEVEEGILQSTVVEETMPEEKEDRIDFWGMMPDEIKMEIFRYLRPKEIIRCSAVSKAWNKMCFDGQLWTQVDTTEFYHEIPSHVLVKIITSAGPFVKDLNLRGCIQLRDKWMSEHGRISDTCQNLQTFSIEGCYIDKMSICYFLLNNPYLVHLNLSGLSATNNAVLKFIGQCCPNLESLNVSWCTNADTKGLKRVIESCPRLNDLRAGEIRGFDDTGFMAALFEHNTLERLVMHHCGDLTDESLAVLFHGVEPEMDFLTDRPIVPPRKLRHLDLTRCEDLTDDGVKCIAHNAPDLEGLQLSQCHELTDDVVVDILRTTPKLTHLDLEELDNLSNTTLMELAKAPCAKTLEHLNISYCESLGDTGMLQVFKKCQRLKSLDLDNTRISDLALMEASSQMRRRGFGNEIPKVGLRLVVFDCANVTWAGIREIMSSNTYVRNAPKAVPSVTVVDVPDGDSMAPSTCITPTSSTSQSPTPVPEMAAQTFPKEIIQLKCFYGWQMTVDEHTKRVLRGNLAAANRLERKWADYMMSNEEADAGGAGARRRRRRAREAERLYNADDDDGDDYLPGGLGPRRRRARSGGCVVM